MFAWQPLPTFLAWPPCVRCGLAGALRRVLHRRTLPFLSLVCALARLGLQVGRHGKFRYEYSSVGLVAGTEWRGFFMERPQWVGPRDAQVERAGTRISRSLRMGGLLCDSLGNSLYSVEREVVT